MLSKLIFTCILLNEITIQKNAKYANCVKVFNVNNKRNDFIGNYLTHKSLRKNSVEHLKDTINKNEIFIGYFN